MDSFHACRIYLREEQDIMDGIKSLMKCACYASFLMFVLRWRSFCFPFEVSGPIGDKRVEDGPADVVR